MTQDQTTQSDRSNQPHKSVFEAEMDPQSRSHGNSYSASGKLEGKVAIITGGDSGIGRAVAQQYAKEKADVAIIYLCEDEDEDAKKTKEAVESEGQTCLIIRGDIGEEQFCQTAVEKTVTELGHLDILVNNAAEQHPQDSIEDITAAQIERTFRTNVFGMFFLTKAALPHLSPGSAIINTTSVTAYKGNGWLLDYSATKGAIVSFTRSLSQSLMEKQIRVNAVAPGPVWTPLVASTFPGEDVGRFGAQVPMQRAAQPEEIAPCFVFLASSDSSYISGQVLHPNGGEIINT
jgi:NAD(P)-dependent dehydrogenase (short-subunit alcohol dehydrogenase family)